MIVRRGSTTGLWRTRRGLGSVSPIGFPDFASFQAAVTASYPPCPPPYDPACEGPRSANISNDLNQWVLNPLDCNHIVCNAAGQPAAAGAIPLSSATTQTVAPAAGSSLTLVSPAFNPAAAPATALPPRGPGRPVPIQSASTATAPGGPLASAFAPVPVQTQTPPPDGSALSDGSTPATGTTALTTAATCASFTGSCAPDFSTLLASIPLWGWGLGVVGLILLTKSGGRR